MNKCDLFFYGTVCHVCKLRGRVKRCSACKMIAYCNAAHQKEHWHSHKSICKCIQSLLLTETGKRNKILNKKTQSRTEFMMLVELKLGRELLPFERQMFWFARKCEICHEFEQDKLEDCEGCASASYCIVKNCRTVDFQHSTLCFHLNLSFELDKYLMENSHPPFLLPPVESTKHLPCGIEAFITRIVSDTNYKGMCPSSDLAIPLYSEVLSCPLTLVYCIELLEMRERNNLVVNVVGAASAECSFIAYWETVLHCLPQLTELFILFIGPECWDQDTKLQLCTACRENGKSLKISMIAQLYHKYTSSPQYLQPHLVAAFNCGLHQTQGSHDDTWAASIPLLLRESPLMLTSYTAEEAQEDIQRLEPSVEKLVDCEVNPYRSLRPHRDVDGAGSKVFYLNTILSIVQKPRTSRVCAINAVQNILYDSELKI